MSKLSRRTFLQTAAVSGAGAGVLPQHAFAQTGTGPASPNPGSTATPAAAQDVTRTLARYVVNARYDDLPAPVRKEGTRTLLNWVGCAIGGSQHPTVDLALAALVPFSGPGEASVLGRKERLDPLHAALVNGMSSHVFDFDDTHLKTVIHPAGPVVSAILALAQHQPVSGRDFLNALVLGVETECRIGNAVYPQHYAAGWHITGTCGVFGSAAATGKLLGLDETKMAWAFGLAASQPVGLKISFGSMMKSFNPGRAAQNGLVAALLASKGYTSTDRVLEGKDGWGGAVSTKQDWAQVTEGLGSRYEAALNTYKPFACGIVTHPAIDAAIQLRTENRLAPDQIDSIDLRVHPLVLSLTGKRTPQVGLEGKFSIYHCVAVGIVEGAAGEKQFSDRAVRDPVIVALRDKVTATVDPAIHEEQVRMTVRLKDGKVLEKYIAHAIGSLERPMTDADLERKFSDLSEGILSPDRIRRTMDLCWGIDRLESAADIAQSAAATT